MYRGYEAARKELRSQLDGLEDKRRDLARQLNEPNVMGANRAGLEQRITDVDKRLSDVERQISMADQSVAKSAAIPGAVAEPPRDNYNGPPDGAFAVGGLFILVVLLPISLAFARRIWRRGSAAVVAFPQELADRLSRLDQSVDSIAVEVERIGEGQRFVTRVLTDSGSGRSLGAGAAVPIELGREAARAGLEKGRSST